MSDVEQLPTYKDVEDEAATGPPGYQQTTGGRPSDVASEEARSVMQGPPPSYDSIFGKIKDAHGEHGYSFGFAKSLFTILAASIGGLICVALVVALMALPIAQVVIGAKNRDECPAQSKIPLYMIISGAFGIGAGLIQIVDGMCCGKDDGDDNSSKCPCLGFLLKIINLFMLAWFICGNVWVYGIYKSVDHEDPASEDYCGKLVYLFAFWCITSVYIILGATCVIGCCLVCVMACLN